MMSKTELMLILLTSIFIFQVNSQTFGELDFLNFSVIDDPKVRYYAKEYNRLCPYTHMCNVQVDVDYSIFQMTSTMVEVPCCGRCECGDDCLKTLDCCPDKLPRLLTSEEVKAVHASPVECIHAQYRNYYEGQYNGKSYLMIGKCAKNYIKQDVIGNCLKEYSVFDFAKDIPHFLPVTDKTTNLTYKNTYCATCNYIPESSFIFWDVKVGIFKTYEVEIQKLTDIEELFKVDEGSNAVFEIPEKLSYDAASKIQLCQIYIDRCNVTGLWEVYDPDVESLCVSYESIYKGYKNIHCYICNGFPNSTIEQICEDEVPNSWRPSSFVQLLDFNNLESKDSDSNVEGHSCEDNQLYDAWVNVCRDLLCTELTSLYQHECHPAFTKMSRVTFDFVVRMIPTKGYTDIRIIPFLINTLEEDIDRMKDSLAEIGYSAIQMYLKLSESLSNRFIVMTNKSQNDPYKENIQYVAVRFIINVNEVTNISEFVQRITEKLLALNLDITGGFDVELANISFALYEERVSANYLLTPGLTQITTFNLSLFAYNPERYGIFEAFDDPVDGRGLLAVNPTSPFPYPNSVRIMPFFFCPAITLSKEFTIQNDRTSIYIIPKDSFINTSEVVFYENNSNIILCYKDYFSSSVSKQDIEAEYPKYNAEVILSIVCTSVSMLCLIIVLITYSIFRPLRTLPGLNNMALSVSLFSAQLFYLLGGVIEITTDWLCKTFGVLLHFSLLAYFFWTGVCSFHMMRTFIFISRISAPDNTVLKFIKYSAFVTISSTVLVVVNIVVSISADSTIGYGGQSCYINSKYMILYTVAIPLGVIILLNLIMFIYVIIKVCNLPEVQKNTKHERNNIVIFAKLSTLTGMTWIFAFLYQWTQLKAFSYMFIITNASQGLFILFSFIANRRVLSMITTLCKNRLFKQDYKAKLIVHSIHITRYNIQNLTTCK